MANRSPKSKVRYRISLYMDVPIEAEVAEYINRIDDDLRLRGIELRRLVLAGYRVLANREGGLLAEPDREQQALQEFHQPLSPLEMVPAAESRPENAPGPTEPSRLVEPPAVAEPKETVTSSTTPAPEVVQPQDTTTQGHQPENDAPRPAPASQPAPAPTQDAPVSAGAGSSKGPGVDSLARMKAKMASRRKPAQ